jgi:lactoylglutathione lyase
MAFYRQFDFEVIRADFQQRVVVLRHPGGVLLNLLDSAHRRVPARNLLMDEPVRYTGYTHMALEVADIRRAQDDLDALGISITEGPVTFGDGKTSIFVRDPDRNVIEFTECPPGEATAGETGA